jgi:hypothetical protein
MIAGTIHVAKKTSNEAERLVVTLAGRLSGVMRRSQFVSLAQQRARTGAETRQTFQLRSFC